MRLPKTKGSALCRKMHTTPQALLSGWIAPGEKGHKTKV